MQRLTCESCGSDLPTPDSKGYSRCPSCGQTSRVEEPAPPPQPSAPRPLVTVDRYAAGPTTRAGGRSGAIALVVVLVAITVSIVVTVAVLSPADGNGPLGTNGRNIITLGGSFRPIAEPGVAPELGTDGAADALAVVQEYTDDSHRYLTRFSVGTDAITERWRSPELPKDASNVAAARLGDTVYAGVADHVWALDEATGKRRWIADLDDEIPNGCPECFVTVAGQLVVRTKDSQLVAFAPASAEPRWKLRLDSPAATVTVSGDRLFVLDDKVIGDDPAVRTVDPVTGATTATFSPSCPDPERPERQMVAGTGNPILALEGSTDLAIVFSRIGGCVVRWDPATGAVRYANALPEIFPISADTILAEGNDLVYPGETGGLTRIDLTTGAVSALDAVPDVKVSPDRIVGDTLIALTSTERGSARGGVAAWDLQTGKVRWQVESPDKAKAHSDSSDVLFDGTALSVLLHSTDGLRLLVFDPESVTTYGIDLTSGALSTGKPRALPRRNAGTPTLDVEAAEPTRVVATIDHQLLSIPAGSGDIVAYPATS